MFVHKKIVIRSRKQGKFYLAVFVILAHCGLFFAFLESMVLVDKDARADESLANTSLVLVDENGQLKFTTGIHSTKILRSGSFKISNLF